MIKKIQLGGISRDPSDKLSAEGACAESLNVHNIVSETAPNLSPKEISSDYGFVLGEPVFIHKGYSYENLIYIYNSGEAISLRAKAKGSGEEYLIAGEFPLDTDENPLDIKDITAIGNTLVVATTTRMLYALFKDGEYIYLGEKIPEPEVEIRDLESDYINPQQPYVRYSNTNSTIAHLVPNDWDNLIEREGAAPDDITEEDDANIYALREFTKNLIETVNENRSRLITGDRYAKLPIFIRYAVRLYDDSYIYQSDPFLMGSGYSQPYFVYGREKTAGGQTASFFCDFSRPFYSVMALLHKWTNITNWTEIVKGIDFFATDFILHIGTDTKISGITYLRSETDPSDSENINYYKINLSIEEESDYDEDRIVRASSGPFYKIFSFDVDSIDELFTGVNLFKSDDIFNGNLSVQRKLEEGYLPYHSVNAAILNTYNNRLLLSGVSQTLPEGSKFATSPFVALGNTHSEGSPTYSTAETKYRFKWYCRKDGRIYSAVSPVVSWYNYTFKRRVNIHSSYYYKSGRSVIKGWLSYPDPNCYRVDVEVSEYINGTTNPPTVKCLTHKMKSHPGIPYSYAYWGLGNSISEGNGWTSLTNYTIQLTPSSVEDVDPDALRNAIEILAGKTRAEAYYIIDQLYNEGETVTLLTTSDVDQKNYIVSEFETLISVTPTVTTDSTFDTDENPTYSQDNLLLLSASSNPFVYPPDGYISFYSTVLNTAAITTPLSEGQFGEFPLYVFTAEGIWALTLNQDGSFGTMHPIANEILINRDALAVTEQAVVFASEKGIIGLSGRKLTDLSPLMKGEHYNIQDDSVAEGLVTPLLVNYVPEAAYTDTTPFLQFLKNCQIAYDAVNQRVIVFNPSKVYYYVYYMQSQTWHKETLPYLISDESDDSDDGNVVGPIKITRSLKSYPRLTVAAYHDLSYSIFDLSETISGDEDQPVLAGLVISRPLILDAPDTYKTINHLKIRGHYQSGHLKWLLMGSNDGFNYTVLHSLRGPSWKMFRLFLVSNLTALERISYVEVDYTPKFLNKVR